MTLSPFAIYNPPICLLLKTTRQKAEWDLLFCLLLGFFSLRSLEIEKL